MWFYTPQCTVPLYILLGPPPSSLRILPAIRRDQWGQHYIFDPRYNEFRRLNLGNIIKVGGPLLVKYLLPLLKQLFKSKELHGAPHLLGWSKTYWDQLWVAAPVMQYDVTNCYNTWMCSHPACLAYGNYTCYDPYTGGTVTVSDLPY